MHQIQRSALDAVSESVSAYDPLFCKTCQKLGYTNPEPARTLFSDCEEHFQKRVVRLRLTGVWVV
ncbi:MAG: hypothetical protein OK457_00085 [Thaumarchaeota archaeon]|nr:hypothetical protein [Nitrososphaerota archaeon]